MKLLKAIAIVSAAMGALVATSCSGSGTKAPEPAPPSYIAPGK